MIRKDMKVGDTFVDGEQTYKVIEVLDSGNYISKAVTAEEMPKKRTVKDNGGN